MANLYNMKNGQSSVEVIDYYKEDSPTVKIPLSPQLSPSQNAQKYYKRYNKAKNAEIEEQNKLKTPKMTLNISKAHLPLSKHLIRNQLKRNSCRTDCEAI